ncbi:porin family protein [Bradyrhizobium sp. U87765 SZCCT0131]|nr:MULTISPECIES: outer membrane protein [unclassified Bradyrhizobium]MBR1221020.1 porin family protein [Bradyrhizobium sp. U87765 SZCCT0131]MBR1260160.1 porin family protein [Bradyrhizobium sp. U87765 SZCCT0134]MBR1307591.1 porin family protein [Bradyrhizobium sp. U87765 SZCCT0110]MBR1321545.1 porin family protein [Bradyrhizobium sp. U87765 SZCCT0109]MBR1349858.1 porin family protein [Bradyrhizobium sp. U87765 SZCCT0048]
MKPYLTMAMLAVSATATHAADLSTRAPYYKAPLAQVYDWTGFYAGVNVGVGVGQNKATNATPATNNASFFNLSPMGAAGGGQLGYNYQFGHWVVGAEADIQGITVEQSSTPAICATNCRGNGQLLSWFGTVRGRVGYATGPVLSYVTGGFAYGDVKTSELLVIGGVPGTFQNEQTRTGWTLGSGVEAALGGNWTGKIEYLYVDLGRTSDTFVLGGATRVLSSDIREHVFRAGLNYRFGGNATTVFASAPADWRGFYLGANAGSGISRDRFTQTIPAGGINESFTTQARGFLGGVQAGYNWQATSWVFGLEADFQGSTQKDDRICLVNCLQPFTLQDTEKLPWFGTVRGRIGYDIGQTLFYVTGGLAYGQTKTTITETFVGTTNVTSLSHTRTGWTAGGGIESPLEFLGWFGRNWTAKTEYLYVDLGSNSDSYNTTRTGFPNAPIGHTYANATREHIFRTGLNYHFNTPVIAKY